MTGLIGVMAATSAALFFMIITGALISDSVRENPRDWRRHLATLIWPLLFVLWVADEVSRNWRLRHRAKRVAQRIETLFRCQS